MIYDLQFYENFVTPELNTTYVIAINKCRVT